MEHVWRTIVKPELAKKITRSDILLSAMICRDNMRIDIAVCFINTCAGSEVPGYAF